MARDSSTETNENKNVLMSAAVYLAVILVIFVIAIKYSPPQHQKNYVATLTTGSAVEKTLYYKQHKRDYNLVFIGDSRTHCGIHPELIDAVLGTRSVNLSVFAHWFPTQFPQIQDIISAWPPNTVMVWTIGSQNFEEVVVRRPRSKNSQPKEVGLSHWSQNSQYNIGFKNVPQYLIWGFELKPIAYNLYKHSNLFHLVEMFRYSASNFKTWTSKEMHFKNVTAANNTQDLSSEKNDNDIAEPLRYTIPPFIHKSAVEIVGQLKKDSSISSVSIDYEKEREISVTAIRKSGAYYRIELDPAFFRQKQKEDAPVDDTIIQEFQIDASYMNIFLKTLDIIKEKNIHLIVNEIEEAPYFYGNTAMRKKYSEKMRRYIEPEVHKRGFDYIRVDLNQITDESYFDKNHFNSKGVQQYTHLLADELRPLLKKYGILP